MFLLENLQKTVSKRKKRVGRGEGSNRGKNSGKGHKGQVKRGKVRIGFEGGQKPLNRRLPKYKGFKSLINKQRLVLTLSSINKHYQEGETVSIMTLKSKGIANKNIKEVRIINTGILTKSILFEEGEGLYLTKGAKNSI